MKTQQKVSLALLAYENAEDEIQKLISKNAPVFDRLRALEREQVEIHATLKALLASPAGPPSPLDPELKSHVWAKGKDFQVMAQYKRRSHYYDPAKLPASTLLASGMIIEVNTARCDALVAGGQGGAAKVAEARVEGEWMTVVVTITPRKEGEA